MTSYKGFEIRKIKPSKGWVSMTYMLNSFEACDSILEQFDPKDENIVIYHRNKKIAVYRKKNDGVTEKIREKLTKIVDDECRAKLTNSDKIISKLMGDYLTRTKRIHI